MLNNNKNSKVFKRNAEEHWKDIEGFPGYMVSDQGRVKSLKFDREKILKQSLGTNGYPHVTLYKEGEKQTTEVHRLVAEAFLGKPGDNLEVNHKNGIKTDNRLCNLQWVTNLENLKHAFEIGLRDSKPLEENDVLKIIEYLNAGIPGSEIAKIFNVTPTAISQIKTGKRWSHLTGRTPKNSNPKNPAISEPITVNINIFLSQGAI